MSDKSVKREMMIEKRSNALAIVYLTSRDDLAVEELGNERDEGIDLAVRPIRKRKQGSRQFGVIVKGSWDYLQREDAEIFLKPYFRELKHANLFPFPVCIFFFSMDGDRGWYAWVAEPAVTSGGEAKLRMHKRPTCNALDRKAIDEIVERVDSWYDAFYEGINDADAKQAVGT